ncbi:hypothetical protein [Mycolicibacterium goodii]|jgi:hypothetical protein|uniref:hypothetical protein n=1 Tax=Mycolicibacterium goodii TaxID=134601 RepID=UPI001BDC50F0|nr:hypothetical protein [Mycolicibacterium goodii]MBU8812333.1 hypothetical protein [Mycolicibacterium goodii]MBU8819850.1 hypothetical protein [Mycolicibacterium goodii]MBU8833955.1 hypothetical protein [Mycolicibacterium goodii]MBU8841014.1 hypothetical protein [Mycolicibacterium goodii]
MARDEVSTTVAGRRPTSCRRVTVDSPMRFILVIILVVRMLIGLLLARRRG